MDETQMTNITPTELGTEELRLKRANNLTTEALDLLLANSSITSEEHSAGIYFRRLYKQRFGSPHVKAYNFDIKLGKIRRHIFAKVQEKKEREYKNATSILEKCSLLDDVLDICVFDIKKKANLPSLRDGLSLLSDFFQRGGDLS
jgi:hypothetical protein